MENNVNDYEALAYSRLQFLRAISHSLGAHTEAFQFASDDDDDDADRHPLPLPLSPQRLQQILQTTVLCATSV